MPSDRIAVVAGAGPGLGAALCRQLGSRGWTVAALARRPQTAWSRDAHWCTPPGRTIPVACDLTDSGEVHRAFAEVRREGAVSALVYNAAARPARSPFIEVDAASFEASWRAGAFGAFLCAQAVLPGMLEAGGGTIVFTGATASLRGGRGFAAFASGKFALRGLAQSLAREFGPRGVHVAHVIVDGQIDRDAATGAQARDDTRLDPDAIAKTYCSLIEQERSAWTHEFDLRPDRESF